MAAIVGAGPGAALPLELYFAIYAGDAPTVRQLFAADRARRQAEQQQQARQAASRVSRPLRNAAATALASLGHRAAPSPLPPLRSRVDRIGDRTPLMLACKAGKTELVAWLLRPESDAPSAPPAPTPAPTTAAAPAAEAEDSKEEGEPQPQPPPEQQQQKQQQQQGAAAGGGGGVAADPACLNAQDEEGASALHHACCAQDLEAIDLLLDAGIDVDLACDGDWTAFLEAARGGHAPVLSRLVDGLARRFLARPETAPLEEGEAPPESLEAAKKLAAEVLCEAKAHGDRTALWWAAYMGHHECVKLLLGYGCADPFEADIRNRDALDVTAGGVRGGYQHRKEAKHLLKAAVSECRRYDFICRARGLVELRHAVTTTLKPPVAASGPPADAVVVVVAAAMVVEGQEELDATATASNQPPIPSPPPSPTTRHRRAFALLPPVLKARVYRGGGFEALPRVKMAPPPAAPTAPLASQQQKQEEQAAEAGAIAAAPMEEGSETAVEAAAAMVVATAPTPTPTVAAAAPAPATHAQEKQAAEPIVSVEEEAAALFAPTPPEAIMAVPMEEGEGEGHVQEEGTQGSGLLVSPIQGAAAPFLLAHAPVSMEEGAGKGSVTPGRAVVPMSLVSVGGDSQPQQEQGVWEGTMDMTPAAMSEGEEGGKGVKRPHAEIEADEERMGEEDREHLVAVARHVVFGGLDGALFKELDAMLCYKWYTYTE